MLIFNTFSIAVLPYLFCSIVFWIIIFPLLPPASLSAAVHCQSPLVCTRSPPPLLVRSASHLDVAFTRYLTGSAALPCAPCRMPTPVAVSCAGSIPVLLTSACTHGPVSPWVFFPITCTSSPPCPCLPLPGFSSEYCHRPVFGLLSGIFLHSGERPGHFHS